MIGVVFFRRGNRIPRHLFSKEMYSSIEWSCVRGCGANYTDVINAAFGNGVLDADNEPRLQHFHAFRPPPLPRGRPSGVCASSDFCVDTDARN